MRKAHGRQDACLCWLRFHCIMGQRQDFSFWYILSGTSTQFLPLVVYI